MVKIIIHHLAGENVHRKVRRFLGMDEARRRFEALRKCWTAQPNGYRYTLIAADGTVVDSFDCPEK